MNDTEPGPAPDSLASELSLLSGRLELLIAHLASGQVRRQVGVEDLAQAVILELLSADAARSLRGEELWHCVRSVARKTVIEAGRRLRHAPLNADSLQVPGSSSRPSILPAQPTGGGGPGTPATGRADHARLLAAFDALPPEHRQVIGLRRFEGLCAADVAARMGRSESAVHSLFRRALAAWAEAVIKLDRQGC